MEAKKRKSSTMRLMTLAFIVIALVMAFWWFLSGQYYEKTDDAYVGGNRVVVRPQISGSIVSIHADDTQRVRAGDLLIAFDRTDRKLALEEASAQLGSAVRFVVDLYAQDLQVASEVSAQLAEVDRLELDFKRREAVIGAGAVSVEEFTHVKSALLEARARLAALEHKLERTHAQVSGTSIKSHPAVLEAAERVRSAFVNLRRCEVRSPVSGMVAMRQVQVGESVERDAPLMSVIPLDALWVDANFKEHQLRHIRPGQPAEITADLYGKSVVYEGVVNEIGAATGSVFSVLPPQNASGNWIKIVQRVPVRILLNRNELKENPLRLGLSMAVKVNTREQEHKQFESSKALFGTQVFDEQLCGAEELIEEIIRSNGRG